MEHEHEPVSNHYHHHHHTHAHNLNESLLKKAFLLITVFMVIEVIGGLLTNSLALLSDAGHMLTDSIALFLSILAFWFSGKPANKINSYGYRRAEIIVALFNGFTLIILALYIFYEGIKRLAAPPEIYSLGMLMIALTGLIVNLLTAWILLKGNRENLNLRSALFHVIGDLLGSLGAILAALLIWFFDLKIADPITSMLVAAIVLISGWRISVSSINVLMESVPKNINIENIRTTILKFKEITALHDLHVWAITPDFLALSCHIVLSKDAETKGQELVYKLRKRIKDDYGIEHSTIQIETDNICHNNECYH